MRQVRDDITKYIKDNLPEDLRGKFISSLRQDISRKKAASILARVDRLAERATRKELIGEIKELTIPSPSVAVDYQKNIIDVMRDIDLVKPTEKTLRRLRGLRDYIAREGEPLGISPQYVDRLRRLTQKNIQDMTTQELSQLKETLSHLTELGRVKRKLRLKYIERERQMAKERLIASTHNIDPKIDRSKRILSAADKWKIAGVRNYMDSLHTARVADWLDGFKGELNPRHFRSEFSWEGIK